MISLDCQDIDPLFLHSFLKFYNVMDAQIAAKPFRNIFRIGNQDLINVITLSYFQFQNWKKGTNKTLEDFLDKQILFVNVKNGVGYVKEKEISRPPIFVAKHYKLKNKFRHGHFVLKSRHPIKMPLEYILRYHNLDPMSEIEFESCPPTVRLVKVQDGKAFTDGDCTGVLRETVTIGKSGDDYYWIPDKKIIKRRFYCTKLPGKCNAFFNRKEHLQKHMSNCSDVTKIKSRQVCSCVINIYSS